MTLIEDLFTSQDYHQALESIEWDPLRETDSLEDTQLLDSRLCPTANRAALLFDMRTAMYHPTGNAGLLVIRGLQSFHWSGAAQTLDLMAFTAVSSRPSAADGGFRLGLDFFPDGNLSVSGEHADFYLLEAHALPEAPPNYTDRHLEQVRYGLPRWDSECTVLQSSTSARSEETTPQ
ncbi:hypothetical protein ACFWU3_34490 [Streptomyces sp. NPDC058685]|uniref:hypothetical protein n=1 Tax=Streptomyces sp. NPDC058685 TaxID=3346598 RepID=UPI0036549E53